MALVIATQTLQIDPNASPLTNVNLAQNFNVVEAVIITNTVKPNGVREITLQIIYDNQVVNQHSVSLETITTGQQLPDLTNVVLADLQQIAFTEFIDHTLVNDTISVTILTISDVSIPVVNQISTQRVQLDPSSPITAEATFFSSTTLKETHSVNVGSLVKTSSVASGTLNSVLLIVAQQ